MGLSCTETKLHGLSYNHTPFAQCHCNTTIFFVFFKYVWMWRHSHEKRFIFNKGSKVKSAESSTPGHDPPKCYHAPLVGHVTPLGITDLGAKIFSFDALVTLTNRKVFQIWHHLLIKKKKKKCYWTQNMHCKYPKIFWSIIWSDSMLIRKKW